MQINFLKIGIIMSLDVHQKLELLLRTKEHWLDVVSTASAYERALISAKKYSGAIKAGTIITALLTTISGFLTVGGNETWAWVTVVIALLTTLLASVEQVYAPTKNYQQFWSCRTELMGVKENLVTFSMTVDSLDDLTKGTQLLTQFSQMMIDITKKEPINSTDIDTKKAEDLYKASGLAVKISRIQTEAGLIGEIEQESVLEVGEDAPDMIPAYRPQTQLIEGVQL